jgi:serpin B
MNTRTGITIGLAVLLTAGAAFGQETDLERLAPQVAGNNDFACELYRELSAEDGNLALSPYSIRTALAMTYAGARNETAKEMERVLRLCATGDALHGMHASLLAELHHAATLPECRLSIANALWAQAGWPLRDTFASLVTDRYLAGLSAADFASDPEAARIPINAWVNRETEERIPELLRAGDLSPLTRVVLVNAMHFHAAWPIRFDPKLTTKRRFVLPADEARGLEQRTIEVPMMVTHQTLPYWRGKGLSILELPYAGDRFSLVLLLPGDPDGLPRLEKALTGDFLQERLSQLEPREIGVFLPRFEVRSRFRLREALTALGMGTAFGEGADFTGMSDRDGLYLDDVFPQAMITVNEEGTEAAGATAVVMRQKGGHGFYATHPFLYLVRDRETGTILFLGRVVNPIEEAK